MAVNNFLLHLDCCILYILELFLSYSAHDFDVNFESFYCKKNKINKYTAQASHAMVISVGSSLRMGRTFLKSNEASPV